MKTEEKLIAENKIITEQNQEIQPVLSQLLDELPITFPDKISHDMYMKAIRDYFESLNNILQQYS